MASNRIRLQYVLVPDWPMLAWLAQTQVGSQIVTVFHGSRIETHEHFFCEAAWAGPFDEGGFDRTDIVAGSGARLRTDELLFVSSGSTVDRLHSLEKSRTVWVSNSLACLMAATGAEVDPATSRYFWLFRTIVAGIEKYQRMLPTSAGNVQLTYFDNLLWNGRTLTRLRKPGASRDFDSFATYERFLHDSMAALAANASAAARREKYELMSTASSGYDSSTVTVLARRAGATKVLCFDQARRGLDDSGQPLAHSLGMEAVVVPRGAWWTTTFPEPPFLAADSHGGDVFYKGAEHVLRGTVLLTGYHGDKVWAKTSKSADENIVRGDQSGLSLSEYRLTTGTLHCPVAFWGVRQIADLHRISNSHEMGRWDVPGDYSRPICRRIVESEGVPREMFGQEKKATWILMLRNRSFLSPESMQDYLGWLDTRRWSWLRRGRVPPALTRNLDHLETDARKLLGRVGTIDESEWFMRPIHKSGAIRVVWRLSEGPSYLRRFLFAWALDRHKRAFPRVA